MVESKPEAWRDIVRRIEDTGVNGIELNYGCPHGMSERGMGSAVGQVPEYCEQITGWVKDSCRIPVIVKLTPNITNIVYPARAAVAAKADAISLINTLNSIVGVDLDTLEVTPSIGKKSGHGGFAGPAVKPIALHMLSAVGTDEVVAGARIPISGMGGISNWQDAAEFLLLGASSLQVCTAVMHYGFRVIEDLCDGLSNWMDAKGFRTVSEIVGKSLPHISDFANFDLSFSAVARIDASKCIKCNLCYVACNDAAHQCIDLIAGAAGERPQPQVREKDCVGCRLCYNVCPVEQCIEMAELANGRAPVSWRELCQAQPEVAEDWDAMDRYRKQKGIRVH
jgi:dihydropyrimidine dehydrogenase (NAD+) subunit PreA